MLAKQGKTKSCALGMTVIFAGQSFDSRAPSIFLAGPTPRSRDVPSWRPGALDLLREFNFAGTVLILRSREDWTVPFSYADQVEWEYTSLESCSVIAFWVPRDMSTLPGRTTNVEFGRYVASGRCVYGRPDGARHTSYLDWLYKKMTGKDAQRTLVATMREAVAVLSAASAGSSRPDK